jgi:hypothetical protein
MSSEPAAKMRADNAHHLASAARQRAEQTRAKALRALTSLDERGHNVTFDAVAREAGISRSWLYSQPDIRAHIDHLRTQRPSPPPAPPPQRQRASNNSLMHRLEATTERLRHLEAENRELHHALAEALGQARQRHVTGARPDTPGKPAPRIIGPC